MRSAVIHESGTLIETESQREIQCHRAARPRMIHCVAFKQVPDHISGKTYSCCLALPEDRHFAEVYPSTP